MSAVTARRRLALLFVVALAVNGCTSAARRSNQAASPRQSARSLAPLRSPNIEEMCMSDEAFEADVDGDDRKDRVYQTSEDGTWVGVCTAAGVVDQIEVGGQGQIFGTADVEPNGRDEIVTGATTGTGRAATILVLVESKLREVTYRGKPLDLFYGDIYDPERMVEQPQLLDNSAWGCTDIDDDGEREIIEIEGRWSSRSEGRWTRRAYTLEDSRAILVGTTHGRLMARPHRTPLEVVTELAGEDECGHRDPNEPKGRDAG
jgi:hypothetical protein